MNCVCRICKKKFQTIPSWVKMEVCVGCGEEELFQKGVAKGKALRDAELLRGARRRKSVQGQAWYLMHEVFKGKEADKP